MTFPLRRQREAFHDPKKLSAPIAIKTAELMEHFQWLGSDQLDGNKQDPAKMSPIGEEVADVAAYRLSLAMTMDIDVSSALQRQIKRNALKYPANKDSGLSR